MSLATLWYERANDKAAPKLVSVATNELQQENNCFFFLWSGYGMTELSPVCHVTPFDNIKYGSVGVLLPNLECKVSNITR